MNHQRPVRILVLVLLLPLAAVSVSPDGAEACRFWALIGSDYPPDLIRDHLETGSIENLQRLGSANRDGWGLAAYLPASAGLELLGPIVRRGGPPASHPTDPEYREVVRETAAIRPRAAIAHVRAGTSGHWGVPNPHPFIHRRTAFAHNGTVSVPKMLELIEGGETWSYLADHPTDYVADYIDSELYYVYILKVIAEDPKRSVAESIRLAVRSVIDAGGLSRLNFVMTAGDTLYALRCAPNDTYDPVRFYPEPGSEQALAGSWPPYWVVASQIVGSTDEDWGRIPDRTLGIFVPGEAPRFVPIVSGERIPGSPPLRLRVTGVSPNPVRGIARIGLAVPTGGVAAGAELYDVQGRLVGVLPERHYEGGEHEITWDCRDAEGNSVPAGVYIARIAAGGTITEERFTIIR